MNQGCQPRFAAYAAAHGRTPDEQLAHDKEAWPGGCMCGFMLWIQAAWRQWATDTGERGTDGFHGWNEDQHARFDLWLAEGHARTIRVDP